MGKAVKLIKKKVKKRETNLLSLALDTNTLFTSYSSGTEVTELLPASLVYPAHHMLRN